MTRKRRCLIGAVFGFAVGVVILTPSCSSDLSARQFFPPLFVHESADGRLTQSGRSQIGHPDSTTVREFHIGNRAQMYRLDIAGDDLVRWHDVEVVVEELIWQDPIVHAQDAKPVDRARVLTLLGQESRYWRRYMDSSVLWKDALPTLLIATGLGAAAATFLIRSRKPGHCTCGYNLRGLTSDNCPECGREVSRGG